jgi:diacylglycerol kinase (ATP)
MLVLINPKASGGAAIKKWKIIEPELAKKLGCTDLFFLNGNIPMQSLIKAAMNNGETHFISAGGDGTLNLLINSIIEYYPPKQLNEVIVGAVGIGSSNDFYKPFPHCERINNIPVKINFENRQLRDIGKITFNNDGPIKTKYFLINSSIGITADANYFFNNPDKILSSLKRKSTPAAILYAAARGIYKYENFDAEICTQETGKIKAKITNLGIVKNPNFSGNMNYGYSANYENGFFNIHLCYEMNLIEKLKLFRALNNGNFNKVQKTKSWLTRDITIKSELPFAVEYDGEIIKTAAVEFSVLPKFLRICK